MNINEEIERIVIYQNSMLLIKDRKSEKAIGNIIENIKKSYIDNNFDFTKFDTIHKKQVNKIRHIKKYKKLSCEEILCIYLKRLLDRKYRIQYPNRNEFMHSLFDVINALRTMHDYTIVKFDFKDYFNSVSSEYVYKKYLVKKSLERDEMNLLEKYVTSTKYAYAGFNASNIICEIIAKHFDEVLNLKFRKYGLIFYRRYIDDGILIFNKHVDRDFCLSIINGTIKEIFYDKNIEVENSCKTCLNTNKFKYISANVLAEQNQEDSFSFLGYMFVLEPKLNNNKKLNTKFKFGITEEKIKKYSKRVDDLLQEYKKHGNMELLQHQIKAFSCRCVYQISKNGYLTWKTKGFISNYQELRYRLDCLTEETEEFLRYSIINAFENSGVQKPYFLKVKDDECSYNLYNNMKKYKTLLFVERIGIGKDTLKNMCEQIGISSVGKDYNGLVRDFLIKVKVGH